MLLVVFFKGSFYLKIYHSKSIYIVYNSANIEYVKWDMNRPLTEVYSLRANDFDTDAYPTGGNGVCVWQSESTHRYVLGLYELQNRITKTFPHILLENCSSGG
jgi:alpha-galactosidase